MYQVFFEKKPYTHHELAYQLRLAAQISSGADGKRPNVPIMHNLKNNENLYLELMKECWDYDPLCRPSFEDIHSRLKELRITIL
jgi:hypothetical protein